AHDSAAVVLNASNPLIVPDNSPTAHLSRPVPHLDVPVTARRHHLSVVYLDGVNCGAVSLQTPNHGPRRDHGKVVGRHGEVVAVVFHMGRDRVHLSLSKISVPE